jgi:fumarate reductase flavoprotein subunit
MSPFYALPLCAGITYTTGGLLIDQNARVLRENKEPIDGLYAAGSAVGGIEGGPQASYVGGLMKALVLGLVAAEHVAKTVTLTSANAP